MSNSNRYQIRRGSQSNHCCFVATIVDTSCPIATCSTESGKYFVMYRRVAEFFDKGVARITRNALNAADRALASQKIAARTRDRQNAFIRGLQARDAADKSPEVAALRAARALKKLNKENSNG